MNATLDHWTIIFLFGAAQGIFLFFMFLFNKKQWQIMGTRLIAFIVLIFSVMLLYYVAYWSNILAQLPPWFLVFSTFTFLLGPIFYIYIKSFHLKEISNDAWYHFIPMAIIIVMIIFELVFPQTTANIFRASFGNSKIYILPFAQNIHLLIYALLIWSTSQKHVKNTWANQVTIAYYVYTGGFVLYYIMVWTNTLAIEYDYMISLIMSVFIYVVGYKCYANPQQISKVPIVKYSNSYLSDAFATSISKKVIEHLEHKAPYKESGYKLTTLAEAIDTTPHIVSQVLNQYMQTSFNELLNNYRIREAKRLLETNPDLSVISVAYTVGFNNKVTFNNSFKKLVGLTPGQFKSNSTLKNQKLKIA